MGFSISSMDRWRRSDHVYDCKSDLDGRGLIGWVLGGNMREYGCKNLLLRKWFEIYLRSARLFHFRVLNLT